MKRLKLDMDVIHAAQKYVNEQIAVMEKYGSIKPLSTGEYGDLVYQCAEPIQMIRNLHRKAGTK